VFSNGRDIESDDEEVKEEDKPQRPERPSKQ